MLKYLLNPTLQKELRIDQKPSGWAERTFRISIGLMVVLGVTGLAAEKFYGKSDLAEEIGSLAPILGITFGLCALYNVNYAAVRFVRRSIGCAVFALEGMILMLFLANWLLAP